MPSWSEPWRSRSSTPNTAGREDVHGQGARFYLRLTRHGKVQHVFDEMEVEDGFLIVSSGSLIHFDPNTGQGRLLRDSQRYRWGKRLVDGAIVTMGGNCRFRFYPLSLLRACPGVALR